MSTYICHNCEIKIRLKNRNTTGGSAFAEVCPVCETDDELEYL